MTKIEIYSKSYCPYCKRAKATLSRLGLDFEEFEITDSEKLTKEMQQRSGEKNRTTNFYQQATYWWWR